MGGMEFTLQILRDNRKKTVVKMMKILDKSNRWWRFGRMTYMEHLEFQSLQWDIEHYDELRDDIYRMLSQEAKMNRE